jgi:hypothetical protein
VLAVRTAFESADALGDAELDRLVVRGVEMQAWVMFERVPVPAFFGGVFMGWNGGVLAPSC